MTQALRAPSNPAWVANDVAFSAGALKVRCRARCFACAWRGIVRTSSVPDDLDVKATRAGSLASVDALRHAERCHDWKPAA